MTTRPTCPKCGRLCKLEDIRGLGFALIATCPCGYTWGVNHLWEKIALTPALAKLPQKKRKAKI